jgi:hypothetical protein
MLMIRRVFGRAMELGYERIRSAHRSDTTPHIELREICSKNREQVQGTRYSGGFAL